MRAIRLHGPGDIRLEDVPLPRLRPGTVMIKVSHAGICGSDLFLLRESPIPQEYTHPLTGERGPHILGHEFSGLVTEVAGDVGDIDAGALVAVEPILFDGSCAACRRGDTNLCDANGFIGIHGWGGGMSEYVVVPADRVHVMPPELTAETAALIEPLAVAWRSVSRSGLRPGDTALISGAGPIGLALLLVAKARGAGAIVMSEPTAVSARCGRRLRRTRRRRSHRRRRGRSCSRAHGRSRCRRRVRCLRRANGDGSHVPCAPPRRHRGGGSRLPSASLRRQRPDAEGARVRRQLCLCGRRLRAGRRSGAQRRNRSRRASCRRALP